MFQVNQHYLELDESYLFSTIARKVEQFSTSHPGADIIRLGIGDVTLPLSPAVISALHRSVDEMGERAFSWLRPRAGYAFLREAIAETDFKNRGIDISPSEIFVSDGSKSDTGNIGDIWGEECGGHHRSGLSGLPRYHPDAHR